MTRSTDSAPLIDQIMNLRKQVTNLKARGDRFANALREISGSEDYHESRLIAVGALGHEAQEEAQA